MAYKDKNKYRAWDRAYYYKRRATRLFNAAKTRAKNKDIPFDISQSDIVIPAVCPALGIPLILDAPEIGKKWGKPGSPSVDRIDPSKGYVRGNVQVISWRANSLKKNATSEELMKVALFVAKQEER